MGRIGEALAVRERGYRLSVDPSTAIEGLEHSSRSLWLGMTSFEERCSASLEALAEMRVRVSAATALEYAELLTGSYEERQVRGETWRRMLSAAESISPGNFTKEDIAAYSYQGLQERVRTLIEKGQYDCVIFDITCMTKVHAMALATLTRNLRDKVNCYAAYSIPENYNHVGDRKKMMGWRDIILAPLVDAATLVNESQSRGIVIPGHEADRLIVALAELEPSGGKIIFTNTPRRPDLRYVSQKVNNKAIRQLTRKRSSAWSSVFVELLDAGSLADLVSQEAAYARKESAPVILFPYGPKAFIFLAALTLAGEYPEASWFVYPVPYSYFIDYTDGIERVVWMSLSRLAAHPSPVLA